MPYTKNHRRRNGRIFGSTSEKSNFRTKKKRLSKNKKIQKAIGNCMEIFKKMKE